MDPNSKYFNMVRHIRSPFEGGKKMSKMNFSSCAGLRLCDADDCARPAPHRAPTPRGRHGFLWFCMEHVRDYNQNYDYFAGMSAAEIVAYQDSELTGHRPTWPLGDRGATHLGTVRAWRVRVEDILREFGGGQESKIRVKMEKRTQAQRIALSTLGLKKDADANTIRNRFKILVKRYHPDLNGGARHHEARLGEVIEAYRELKSSPQLMEERL